ncbi:ATP-dependent DNA helicase PIF1-like protein, partial [Tanacetum coccineum]
VEELEMEIDPVLDELAKSISILNLERGRRFKGHLLALTLRVQKLMEYIDDTEDLINIKLGFSDSNDSVNLQTMRFKDRTVPPRLLGFRCSIHHLNQNEINQKEESICMAVDNYQLNAAKSGSQNVTPTKRVMWSGVVEVETWCHREGRIGIKRDWIIKDYANGEALGRATRMEWDLVSVDISFLISLFGLISIDDKEQVPVATNSTYTVIENSTSKLALFDSTEKKKKNVIIQGHVDDAIIRIPLNENSPRVVEVAAAVAAFPSQRVVSLLSGDFGTAWNSRMETGVAGRARPFGIQISNVEYIDFNFNESLYTTEFLNTIKMSGIPHKLVLKIGAPVMCLRNIDQRGGLCNGTRLQVLRMSKNNIEAKIISGGKVGTVVAIPRMNISLSDKRMPFQLNRRQFPVSLCFAMTINKSQGQTLSKVGLYLERPVFSQTLCGYIKSKE